MNPLVASIAQLLFGFAVVGICTLLWSIKYSWFTQNRQLNDTWPRSGTSWNTDHEFFDMITEFRNDFSDR